jgi:hypothetical protein
MMYFDFTTGFAIGGEFLEDEDEKAIFIYLGIFQLAFIW